MNNPGTADGSSAKKNAKMPLGIRRRHGLISPESVFGDKTVHYSFLAPGATPPVNVLGNVVDPIADSSAIEPTTSNISATVVPASRTNGLNDPS